MKQQFLLLGIILAYWIVAGLALVEIVNTWPWLASSPWLFAAFAPLFIIGFALRIILRRKMLGDRRPQP
jgi:hypothetical protein